MSRSHHPSIKEKFEKAVNVIRNLPKHGSYQPSYELKLKFYAYYKQATEGPNNQPRPSFWEVVNRAKWDAWYKLGNMDNEEAMIHYVEELQKIVETMSYTDNVASFVNSLDNFYEKVPLEDLDILIGPVMDRIRSRPDSPLNGSPLASRDTSPSRAATMLREESPLRLNSNNVLAQKHITSSVETTPASSYSASPQFPETEEEDEDFLDTQMEVDRISQLSSKSPFGSGNTTVLHRGEVEDPSTLRVSPEGDDHLYLSTPDYRKFLASLKDEVNQMENRLNFLESTLQNQSAGDTSGCLDSTMLSDSSTNDLYFCAKNKSFDKLLKDVETIERRVSVLEIRKSQEVAVPRKKSGPARWGLSLRTTAVLMAWPVLIMLISKLLSFRRRR